MILDVPFTAARVRNAGFAALRAAEPNLEFPERAPLGQLVRTPNIGGAENAAYFSYPPDCGVKEIDG